MKHIIKRDEPPEFTSWKALANEEWQPSYRELGGKEKQAVKKALMEEQGYICCYCERRLVDTDSHIEHFRPQSDINCDPLDFSNMLCSCQRELHRGKPRHCGNLKKDWFDEALLISPFDPDCEKCFIFTEDGHIYPSGYRTEAASETILHLGLDIPKIVALRKSVIEVFLDENLTREELHDFVVSYLKEGEKLNEFWTTIKYLFAKDFIYEIS